MNYSKKYLKEANKFRSSNSSCSGAVCWENPSNIALIKYWGKKGDQLPQNPSLSFTLSNSITKTRVKYNYNESFRNSHISFLVNGEKNKSFEERISKYINKLLMFFPYLKFTELEIDTKNNFPHSAGMASSASAFSALAFCLTDIEYQLLSIKERKNEFFAKASFISRLGSGSAARSAYGGTVLWGKTELIRNSSDEVATPVKVHEVFNDYRDLVLIVDSKSKEISSTAGHELMNNNPYQKVRYKQACQNLEQLMDLMRIGNTKGFSEIVEYEALSLHAMMMTSSPGNLLVKPNTLSVIRKIRKFRADRSIPVAFTLDAGANVHILFPGNHSDDVMKLVKDELLIFCPDREYILNEVGSGPKKIS